MADLKLGNMTLMGNVKVPPSKSMAQAKLCNERSSEIEAIRSSRVSDRNLRLLVRQHLLSRVHHKL